MYPVTLCSSRNAGFATKIGKQQAKDEQAKDHINWLAKEEIRKRVEALERIGRSFGSELDNEFVQFNAHVRQLLRTCFPGSRFSTLERECIPECVPLNECVLAITWEYVNCPLESWIHPVLQTFEPLANLLPRASAYQAKYQDVRDPFLIDSQNANDLGQNQLIAQSLICLRNCFEVVRVQSAYSPAFILHAWCSNSGCEIDCVAQLEASLDLFVSELSRVFFKKENMRNKDPWWLSAFYSFCIQSYVKKALLEVKMMQHCKEALTVREYLKEPVSLFIASSGSYDPLSGVASRGSDDEAEARSLNEYLVAEVAVSRHQWAAEGVTSSADYLRQLFANPADVQQTPIYVPLPMGEGHSEEEENNEKYCLCQGVAQGDIVACHNHTCPYEWFHWSCVGLRSEPVGIWYCPVCLRI